MDANRAQIVVVGSANVDLTTRVSAMPRPGETILGSDLMTTVGGKGANQAVAAGLLGADVSFVGCRGEDRNGDLIQDSLTAARVSVTHLRTVPGSSGTALITLTKDGENSIIVCPGANQHLVEEQVEEAAALWNAQTLLVVQLECPQKPITAAVRAAVGSGARVAINAAPARELPADVISAAHPFVVNESEADFYLGREGRTGADPGTAARALLDLGAQSVVITVGPDGAWIAESPEGEPVITHVPGIPTTPADTTGAGDAFMGALADGLARGQTIEVAARTAVRVGAYAVERLGAQASYPTLEQLKTFRKN